MMKRLDKTTHMVHDVSNHVRRTTQNPNPSPEEDNTSEVASLRVGFLGLKGLFGGSGSYS